MEVTNASEQVISSWVSLARGEEIILQSQERENSLVHWTLKGNSKVESQCKDSVTLLRCQWGHEASGGCVCVCVCVCTHTHTYVTADGNRKRILISGPSGQEPVCVCKSFVAKCLLFSKKVQPCTGLREVLFIKKKKFPCQILNAFVA